MAIESARSLPPFSYIRIEQCTAGGLHPVWETRASIQTRPMPGWAADGAVYCKTCGKVAHDGEALPCTHSNASEPYGSWRQVTRDAVAS